METNNKMDDNARGSGGSIGGGCQESKNSCPMDNDLTSLSWLQNASCLLPPVMDGGMECSLPTTVAPIPAPMTASIEKSEEPSPPSTAATSSSSKHNPPPPSGKSGSRSKRSKLSSAGSTSLFVGKKKMLVHQKINVNRLAEHHRRLMEEIDYKSDSESKPPYSYAALICLAMKETKKKMTLSQIYRWIRENFAYYRQGDRCWQVRIEILSSRRLVPSVYESSSFLEL